MDKLLYFHKSSIASLALFFVVLFHTTHAYSAEDTTVVRANELKEFLSGAWKMHATGKHLEAIKEAQSVLNGYQDIDFVFGIAESNYALGVFYKKYAVVDVDAQTEHLEKAKNYLFDSVRNYMSIGEKVQASKAVYNLAKTYHGLGDLAHACKLTRYALELYGSEEGRMKKYKILGDAQIGVTERMKRYMFHVCKNG